MEFPEKSGSFKPPWLFGLNVSLLLLGFKNLLPASHALDHAGHYRWFVTIAVASAATAVLLQLFPASTRTMSMNWHRFATALAVLSTAESYLYLYFPGTNTGLFVMALLVGGNIVFTLRRSRREDAARRGLKAMERISTLQRLMESLTSSLLKTELGEECLPHVELMLRNMDSMIADVEAAQIDGSQALSDYVRDARVGLRLVHETLQSLAGNPSCEAQERRAMLTNVLAQMNAVHKRGAAIERMEELRR